MPLTTDNHRRFGSWTLTPQRALFSICAVMISAAYVTAGPSLLPFISPREEMTAQTQDVSFEATPETSADETPTEDVSVYQLRDVDYNESWRQAGPGLDELGETERRHQLLLTAEGSLLGRIMTFAADLESYVPLRAASVHLMREGAVAASTQTDATGHFKAVDLTPGTYSLIAQSEQGVLAYALHVRHAEAGEDVPTTAVQLSSMAAPGWDADAIVSTVERYWAMQPKQTREVEPETPVIPEAVRAVPQTGAEATTLNHHRVHVQPDGRVIGRLRRLHRETGRPIIARAIEVALYRDGELQQMTWTDEVGYFEFGNMQPGVYSLVATGSVSAGSLDEVSTEFDQGLQHGFLTLGIDVVPANESSAIQQIGFAQAGEFLEIDGALIDPVDLQPFLNNVTPDGANSTTMSLANGAGGSAGGGSGGATGGGGGIAGGGSALGTLLGVGAAAGLAVLAGDDDGNRIVSPAVP